MTTCSLGLLQLKEARAMAQQFDGGQIPKVVDFQLYLWIGLVVALGATAFAGPLARLLTFDSEQREPAVDISDQLLDVGKK
ncbi:MAG: hypothetical protein KF897_15740 [Opitutaceae bacterium]|nr:hypothetical protein [Opitutaceae bacterium]